LPEKCPAQVVLKGHGFIRADQLPKTEGAAAFRLLNIFAPMKKRLQPLGFFLRDYPSASTPLRPPSVGVGKKMRKTVPHPGRVRTATVA